METDLFDPSKIDAAVGEAFGTRMPARQPSAPTTPAPLRTNNPGALMPKGRMAEFNTMDEGLRALDQNLQAYGKRGVNTLRDVISQWSPPTGKGNTPQGTQNYIDHVAKVTGLKPDQPIDLSNPLVRLQLTAGITQFESGPGAIYGQQSAAPRPAAAASAAPAAPATPGALSVDDLMKPAAVDAAVADAFNEPPKKGKVAGKVSEFLRGQGRAAASLVDTGLNAVTGALDVAAYPFARAYYGMTMSPEAAAAKATAETTSPKNVVGTAFGVTETPEYKGEASRRAMEYIGGHISEGVDAIQHGLMSMGINLPKADVENMVNQAMLAIPAGVKGAAATKPGQAVTGAIRREAGYAGEAIKAVTPEPVQRAVGGVVEAVAPGTTNMPPKVAPGAAPAAPAQVAPYAQPGRGSVGAAGVPDTAIVKQALTSATPEFQQLYGNMPLDKLNTPVVMRHLEGDSLPVPVRLTKGQASGDLVQISQEQNVRGRSPEIAYQLQRQNQALVDNVPAIRERVAPDVYSPKTIDSSTAIIDAYKKLDEGRNAQITQAYKALEDANGGQFPVDGATLARNAELALGKKLKTEFLPSSIKSQLDRFKAGEPMTFEQFEAMRTNLAAEIRKAQRSGDGNAAQAASIVREALENLPMTGETAALKPLADKARALAKARFDALKKDPAYRAAIDDAVPADKFLEKFVINGHNKNVRTMVDTLGVGSEGHQHMAAGTINWLSDRAGIVDGRGNFSQANYNKALKKLDDANNLHQIFTPESQTMLRTLGNVANYTQFQPRGSFVNNSNTLVGYLAEKGAGALETGANVVGLKTIGYPVGSEARRVIGAARERKFVKEALEPGAGSTLQEISKKGRKQPPAGPSERIEPRLD
jgi:hypothetical protein